MENRAHLDRDHTAHGLCLVPDHDGIPEIAAYGLERTWHAFLRGCRDNIGQPCEVHRTLLAAWSAGDYLRRPAICRVIDAAGQVISQKDCGRFHFHMREFDGDRAADIFVWPDGERTVTHRIAGSWPLNRVEARDHRIGDGWVCWINACNGNNFCTGGHEVAEEY